MQSSLLNFYTRYILNRPIIVIIVLLGVFAYFGYNAKHFRIDASADSLILENDKDFKYYRKISKTYGSHSYMFITYKPDKEFICPPKEYIKQLKYDHFRRRVKRSYAYDYEYARGIPSRSGQGYFNSFSNFACNKMKLAYN